MWTCCPTEQDARPPAARQAGPAGPGRRDLKRRRAFGFAFLPSPAGRAAGGEVPLRLPMPGQATRVRDKRQGYIRARTTYRGPGAVAHSLTTAAGPSPRRCSEAAPTLARGTASRLRSLPCTDTRDCTPYHGRGLHTMHEVLRSSYEPCQIRLSATWCVQQPVDLSNNVLNSGGDLPSASQGPKAGRPSGFQVPRARICPSAEGQGEIAAAVS